MAMTEAERKAEESFLFGGDSGEPTSTPPDDGETLEGATDVTPTPFETDAAVLTDKRRRQTGDDVPFGPLEAPVTGDVAEMPPTRPPEGSRTPMPIKDRVFGSLTDADLVALAVNNVFPKALEVDEREEGWFRGEGWLRGGMAPVEDQYPTEGTVADRLNFLTKRLNQKRENIETAKRQESVGEAAKGYARWLPWISGIPGVVPGAVVGPPYEAGREYIPKAWEKLQQFKARLDRMDQQDEEIQALQKRVAEQEARLEAMGAGPKAEVSLGPPEAPAE